MNSWEFYQFGVNANSYTQTRQYNPAPRRRKLASSSKPLASTMSSGQAPVSFRMQDGNDFQSPTGDAITPMHTGPLDLEQFMMENTQPPRHPSLSQSTPPSLDVLGGSHQFADFSFPYNELSDEGIHSALHADHNADPYQLSAPTSANPNRHSITSMPGDHRDSISSMSGDIRLSATSAPAARASFSSATGHIGDMSNSGDDASPTSNRASGGLETGLNDDFGLHGGGVMDGRDLGLRTRDEKNEANPPWSELKTKAGKERKRLPLACIACRRKKIRCSGEKPACKHCLRSRIPCVYKVTTRKAAPRTDYMAMLDKRLKRMEERIIKVIPKEEQDSSSASVPRAIVKPAMPGTVPARTNSGKKRVADEAFGAELDSWSTSVTTTNVDAVKPPPLLTQEAEETKLLSEGAEALPSKELQEHLAEVFFENIYGQTYPLLHKPSYMRKLRAGTLPPVLILAVCAISARFSTHPKLNTHPAFLRGEEWASEARDIVTRRYDWPNITILTCLLLLGLHEFGTCQGGRSWSLGGQAIRMAYALQLHRDLDYDPQKRNGTVELSFIDREIRRRTMWSCFLMDRFNSSGTDRPTFIKEETIKVQLPIRERFFQLDMPGPTENLQGEVPHPISPGAGELSDARENMGVSAYMIRSIALWGRIINYLNLGGSESDKHPMWHAESDYAELMKQTLEFANSIPEGLKYTEENLQTHQTEGLDNQFLFLHISVQQNMLFMNRFAIPGQSGSRQIRDIPKEFVAKAGSRAFEAANKISDILQDSSSHFVTAPFAGYCAFLSSTVHLFGVFSKNAAMESTCKKNLAINVKYISKMKKYWGMFHWMSENLKEQYRMCADMAKKGPSAGGTSQPSSTIFQYGDWFDRYPHGVSQSDFEDPANGVKKEEGDDAVLEQKSDYHTVEEFFNSLEPPQLPSQGASKGAKRKAKKAKPAQAELPEPINPNPANASSNQHLHMPQNHHLQQAYNQMSPSTPVNMYHQQQQQQQRQAQQHQQHQGYYTNDFMLPAQPSLLPQLDRQLVFGAYANMDPSSLSSQSILDGANGWDMQLGGTLSGFGTEPSSAWFMPFNMEPPEITGEADVFNNSNSLGGSGYGMDPGRYNN